MFYKDAPLFYNHFPVKAIKIREKPISALSVSEEAKLVLRPKTIGGGEVVPPFLVAVNQYDIDHVSPLPDFPNGA